MPGSAAAMGGPEPFGTFALPAVLERLRRGANGLGSGPLARRAVSLIRRLCLAGRADPVDVEPFAGQRARLYPRDNLSEKRVFAGRQFWDRAERAALAQAIGAGGPAPFVFVDAGANAGLYTLFARAEAAAAGRAFRALAIEPDPENARRLRCNLALSGAGAEVAVAELALADAPGTVTLTPAGANRGEIRLGAGGIAVRAATLAGALAEAGLDRVDALKIDIEGVEEPVLRAFLDGAPRGLWPALVLMEARRGEETSALALLRARGYEEASRTRLNVVLTAPSPGATDRT